MKILTIIGARPQFVKAAVVSRALKNHGDLQEITIHTGQHYDYNMSEVFFKELDMDEPEYNLGIHETNTTVMLAKMLESLDDLVKRERPDWILVYGDTNSTLAGALVARINNVKIAHVEAGMRHGDLSIPEELNRVLTDRVSDLLFCSTEISRENLLKEGFENRSARIELCGDVMLDASLYYTPKAEKRPFPVPGIKKNEYVLCTLHRAENVDNPEHLRSIVSALNKISKKIPVIMPVHPRTHKNFDRNDIHPEFQLVEPAGFLDMINLTKNCRLVMTDSGGLQKEAYFFKKHGVVLREQTEWKELEDNGYLSISGSKEKDIMNGFQTMMKTNLSFEQKFYGDGKAGEKIAGILAGELKLA